MRRAAQVVGLRGRGSRSPRGLPAHPSPPPGPFVTVAWRPHPLSYLRRLCLRVASAAVESGLCMSPGALPGPDPLRAIPGVLVEGGYRGARPLQRGLRPQSWVI